MRRQEKGGNGLPKVVISGEIDASYKNNQNPKKANAFVDGWRSIIGGVI